MHHFFLTVFYPRWTLEDMTLLVEENCIERWCCELKNLLTHAPGIGDVLPGDIGASPIAILNVNWHQNLEETIEEKIQWPNASIC